MSAQRVLITGISLLRGIPPLGPLALGLESLTVLYGKNGTGKTRLLHAVAAVAGDPSQSRGDCRLHLELIGPPRLEGRESRDGLTVQILYALRRHADIALREVEEIPYEGGWVTTLHEAKTAPAEALVSALLQSRGMDEDLAERIADQRCYILQRDIDGYHLGVGVRVLGEVALGIERQLARGLEPMKDHGMARHIALTEALRTAVARADMASPWLSHPLLQVVVEDGATDPAILTPFVPAALGLVTEAGLPAALQSLAAEIELALQGEGVLFSGQEVDVDAPVRRPLEEVGQAATQILRTCLPDGPELRVALSPPWSGSDMLIVRAVDAPSGSLVPLPGLSYAQRRWASIAVQLAVRARSDPQGSLLLLLDEPDAGLHPQARRHVADGLATLMQHMGGVACLSTHAAEFLSLPDSHLVHVTRNEGGTALRAWRAGDLTALDDLAVRELGITRGDALTLTRLFLIVEGEHDEALLRTWLDEDISASYTRVVKMRGTHNLFSVLDSQLLVGATDAQMLIVVDATRAALGDEWSAIHAAESSARGKRLHQAKRRLARERPLSDEERRMFELLESAVQTDLVHRVHVHGLSKDDIIEYLDANRVAGRPGVSWPQIKRERREAGYPGPLKDWLRREATITTTSLTALASDVQPDREITALGLRLRHLSALQGR